MAAVAGVIAAMGALVGAMPALIREIRKWMRGRTGNVPGTNREAIDTNSEAGDESQSSRSFRLAPIGKGALIGAIIGIALGFRGGLLVARGTSTTTTTQVVSTSTLRPVVRIVSPHPGESVSAVVTVRGTFERVPAGHKIWILVASPDSDRVYPQTGPAFVQPQGSWTSSNVRFGGGREFDIVALAANPDAVRILQEYLQKAQEIGDYPGVPTLPDGAVELTRVRVHKEA
jgi:hypothetical protein